MAIHIKKRKDITGMRFGMLTAVRPFELSKHQTVRWLFKCDCGGDKVNYIGGAKEMGHCGCMTHIRLHNRFLKHGGSKRPQYKAWAEMKYRCQNPNDKAYKYYGARGVRVCERWQDYRNFVEDMGDRPSCGTIERINNNGNYEPSNCKWATMKEQAANKRGLRMFEINGVIIPLSVIAPKFGIHPNTFMSRISRGITPEAAVSTPINAKYRNHRSANISTL